MELGHLLTRSCLTYPQVSSKVYHDSFCQLDNSVSLPWVIYFEAFYLYVVFSFSCIPVICPKLVSFLTPLQFVHLFCNLSQVYPATGHSEGYCQCDRLSSPRHRPTDIPDKRRMKQSWWSVEPALIVKVGKETPCRWRCVDNFGLRKRKISPKYHSGPFAQTEISCPSWQSHSESCS